MNKQDPSVSLLLVQLGAQRRQEARAAPPGNRGFVMTAQAQPQTRRHGTSGLRKEAAVEREPEERQQESERLQQSKAFGKSY